MSMKRNTVMLTAVAALVSGSLSHAEAQTFTRSMIVLLDESGSMRTERADGQTRFQVAKDRAVDRVNQLAALGSPLNVSVVSFYATTTADVHTAGFVPWDQAIPVIQGLAGPPSTVPRTPLAGSVCDAVDDLVAAAPPGLRILYLGSDGLENNTLNSHPCFGPTSTLDAAPYTPGSWQNLVYNAAVGNVVVQVDLFSFDDIINPLMLRFDIENQRLFQAQAPTAAAPTLEQFMTALAEDSGGSVEVVADDAPPPVLGDFNGDGCVTPDDATGLIQSIGLSVPPADGAFDIDGSGMIDFLDYIAWSANLGNGCQ